MTAREALWIDEEQVAAHVTLAEAVPMVEHALATQARGGLASLVACRALQGDASLHTCGAIGSGFAGARSFVRAGRQPTPLLVLFDTEAGEFRAAIEASALGELCSAAISSVATRWLAAPDAAELAILGDGSEALAQVAAVAHARRLRRVRVHHPDGERRRRFTAELRARLSREVVEAETIVDAVCGVPVVSVATSGIDLAPAAGSLAPGTQLLLAGEAGRTYCALGREILSRADRIVVDDLRNAREGESEIRRLLGDDDASWKRVEALGEVIAERRARTASQRLVVFESLGSAVGELAIAVEVYHRVLRAGGGRTIPRPEPVRARLMPGAGD